MENNRPPQGPRPGGPGGPMGPKGPGGPVEKPKDFVGSLKKLANYSKRYNAAMAVALLLAIISSLFTLIGPNKLSELTDLITAGMMTTIDVEAVTKIVTFLATIYILGLIFGYVQGVIMATISQKISYNLRENLISKINNIPLSYFDTRSYGDT